MNRFAAAAALLILLNISSIAQTPTIQLQPVASGLSSPIYAGHAHDGSNRLFIVEQGGRILVKQPAGTGTSVFLNIQSRVLTTGGEQGLLGLAFHPQYSTNRRFFVNYTRTSDGATVIAQYSVSVTDPNFVDPASEVVILVIDQPYPNHNGGMIEFGPDGYLYIGMGDGGSGNDPENRAQNVNELLGKVLRIDIDNPASETVRYSSPATNPFFGPTAGRDEIFAVGLRNPWRFSFDRSTGQLYLGDVGQNAIEEVDIISLGGNFGWRVYEGTQCTTIDPELCTGSGFIQPITQYTHAGGRCSITGGYVYRGPYRTLPSGTYVYGDFCTGEILMFKDGAQSLLLDTNFSISSFGEDESGEIYVVSHGGTVYRITNPVAPALRRSQTISI
jgi:glucose/arabinose dehydrogenase